MRRPGCRCDESESTPLHIGSLPGYLAGIEESLRLMTAVQGTAEAEVRKGVAPAINSAVAGSCEWLESQISVKADGPTSPVPSEFRTERSSPSASP